MQRRHTNRKQYFRELAQTCEKYFLPFIENHLKITLEHRILEIGYGEGGNLSPFSKRGCEVMGIDISAVRIAEAKQFFQEEGLAGRFSCQDIFSATIDGKFDIIIIHDVIEHVMYKKKLLTLAKNLLNDNGLIYVGFPPWQMPFGGHQQICNNRVVSLLPFIHLLPPKRYRAFLKQMGVKERAISELIEIKECKITIEKFKKLVKETDLAQIDEEYYFINPHYESKFGLKPRKTAPLFSAIPILRNFCTTSYFAVLRNKK
ncbi:class I SAM-dependent methyltransferase [Bacteroides pyogenes]|uniref:class I SAM-dependent methyltransferase n=1 Tax=Bacteroides pyogenes TaxID=310300 RepID=UPI002A90D2B1|nr:class I SAM-dependent methyltransferase [Bacteroides pyogenes]MDY5434624.1 class I SAM-dependent methyltransferase [Bacteroides pyogenes]